MRTARLKELEEKVERLEELVHSFGHKVMRVDDVIEKCKASQKTEKVEVKLIIDGGELARTIKEFEEK